MITKGIIAERFVNIQPKIYRKYILLEKGMKVIHVNLKKYLYGLLQSELLG